MFPSRCQPGVSQHPYAYMSLVLYYFLTKKETTTVMLDLEVEFKCFWASLQGLQLGRFWDLCVSSLTTAYIADWSTEISPKISSLYKLVSLLPPQDFLGKWTCQAFGLSGLKPLELNDIYVSDSGGLEGN